MTFECRSKYINKQTLKSLVHSKLCFFIIKQKTFLAMYIESI